MIIYLAASPIGKLYIGQTTKSLTRRRQDHEYSARHGSLYPFHCAIRKYGANSFVWNIIARADSIAALNAQEAACIAEYNTIAPNGYNMRTGGDSSIPTAESRAKMSAAQKAHWAGMSDERRAELAAANSAARKARYAALSDEAKAAWAARVSAARRGKTHSSEQRAKISAAAKARYAAWTDEDRVAHGAKLRGKKHSPEARANMAAAAKAAWARRKAAKNV